MWQETLKYFISKQNRYLATEIYIFILYTFFLLPTRRYKPKYIKCRATVPSPARCIYMLYKTCHTLDIGNSRCNIPKCEVKPEEKSNSVRNFKITFAVERQSKILVEGRGESWSIFCPPNCLIKYSISCKKKTSILQPLNIEKHASISYGKTHDLLSRCK